MNISAQDDEDALRRMGRLHGRAVRNLIVNYERDRMDVDEILADVFVLAHQNRARLAAATEIQVRTWLLQTARYLCANHVRRALSRKRLLARLQREPLPIPFAPDDEYAQVESDLAQRVQSVRVGDALERLRPDHRQVIVMSALGAHGPEIGHALGVSPAAARQRLMRARIAFKDAYDANLAPASDETRTAGGSL